MSEKVHSGDSASRSEKTLHTVRVFADHVGHQLGITPENTEGTAAVHTLVEKALTERLGSQVYFKSNALAFIYRAFQIEGFLASDPETLYEQLSNTWITFIDVANLKTINEMIAGSSYSVGNEVIHTHAESVSSNTVALTADHTYLIRLMGDEFMHGMSHGKSDLTEQEIHQAIKVKTDEILAEARDDESNILHDLAINYPHLIDKVVHFSRIQDIKLPDNVHRMDDVVEILVAAAEKTPPYRDRSIAESQPGQIPLSKRTALAIKQRGIPSFTDINDTKNGGVLETIIKAIGETTNASPLELGQELRDKRTVLIKRYLPPSFHSIMTIFEKNDSITQDPAKQALLQTIFEEALFNYQFGREKPVLNEWVFDELTRTTQNESGEYVYTVLDMSSTMLVKMANYLEGRLGGTNVIKKFMRALMYLHLEVDSQLGNTPYPATLAKKVGASEVGAYSTEAHRLFTQLLESKNTEVEKCLVEQNYNPALAEVLRIATRLIIHNSNPVYLDRKEVRTSQNMGEKSDELRNDHYLEETAYLKRLVTDYKDIPGILELFQIVMSERPERKIADLQKLKVLAEGISMEEYMTTLLGLDELPLPQS